MVSEEREKVAGFAAERGRRVGEHAGPWRSRERPTSILSEWESLQAFEQRRTVTKLRFYSDHSAV